MIRLHATATAVAIVIAVFGGFSGVWAQTTLTAHLDPSGMVRIMNGEVELAMIELNAHGPNWQHAPQVTATAQVSDLPEGKGKRFVGTLPIPNTDGGAIEYTQQVISLPQGLRLEYDLSIAAAMKLNGLQLSIELPVAQYAGQEIAIPQANGEIEIVGLPEEQPPVGRFQLWSGEGGHIEVAKGTAQALTIELRAATDVVIQDLRQWEHPIYEVRLPAIMQDEGREGTVEDRFHLDFTVTFASPVKLAGP
ncbi:MAG: hypothetical protein ACUVX8_07055 [Candidatus Zipacnadales bacterium]